VGTLVIGCVWPTIFRSFVYFSVVVLMLQDMQGVGVNGAAPSLVIFRLVVPNANCGSLIGKGGSNIRELREVSICCAPHVLPIFVG